MPGTCPPPGIVGRVFSTRAGEPAPQRWAGKHHIPPEASGSLREVSGMLPEVSAGKLPLTWLTWPRIPAGPTAALWEGAPDPATAPPPRKVFDTLGCGPKV